LIPDRIIIIGRETIKVVRQYKVDTVQLYCQAPLSTN